MENQSSRRYRQNSRRIQKILHEKRRRKIIRIGVLAAAGSICLLSVLGIFVYRNFSDNRKKDLNSPGSGISDSNYEQTAGHQSVFDEESLSLEDLRELIVQAENMKQGNYEQTGIDKLEQRIEEAKQVTESKESDRDINNIGVAYMNLIIVMNTLLPVQ